MRTKFGLILIVAFSLVVAACGGGDSDTTTTTAAVAADTTTTTAAATTTTTAAPARDVMINTAIGESGSAGTFTTSGGADVCPDGEFSTFDFQLFDSEGVGIQDFELASLWTYQDRYTCADGSGSFVISGEILMDPNDDDETSFEGTWIITEGTGDYTDLQGSGSYENSTEPIFTEVYTGELNR